MCPQSVIDYAVVHELSHYIQRPQREVLDTGRYGYAELQNGTGLAGIEPQADGSTLMEVFALWHSIFQSVFHGMITVGQGVFATIRTVIRLVGF